MCGSNKNSVVLPSPCLSSIASLTSVTAACPNGATQIPPALRLLTFLFLLKMMCSELIILSHHFLKSIRFSCVLPSRPCSWSFHCTPCPARLPHKYPEGGVHRIGLWTDWLTNQLAWHPSGLRSISSWCSGHPHLPRC